jgi:mannose-6-phosphate isomerase-like protein (cupin superfamily)
MWSLPHGGDLDANLVRLEPGGCIGEHVNDDVDVLVFVRSGTGQLGLGETLVDLASDHLVLIPQGVRRSITAGPAGITYLSVHRRRAPLGIGGSQKAAR